MPLESGTTINDLDTTWPLGGDFISQGDNHIRLLKAVLQTQFPGVAGLGFAIPIIATEEEINWLTGLSANIQGQIDTLAASVVALLDQLNAPDGTQMVFYNSVAPVGWTQITDVSINDRMMRIVNTAGAGVGGADSPISPDTTHYHATTGHILTVAEMPSHTHDSDKILNFNDGGTGQGNLDAGGTLVKSRVLASAGSGNAHDHGDTATATSTWAPKYADVIVALVDV